MFSLRLRTSPRLHYPAVYSFACGGTREVHWETERLKKVWIFLHTKALAPWRCCRNFCRLRINLERVMCYYENKLFTEEKLRKTTLVSSRPCAEFLIEPSYIGARPSWHQNISGSKLASSKTSTPRHRHVHMVIRHGL